MRNQKQLRKLEELVEDLVSVNGVFQITNELQEELNKCTNVSKFPSIFKTAELHPNLEFRMDDEIGRYVVATDLISKGEVISKPVGSKVSKPLRYSRQIGDNVYVVGMGAIEHNCVDPTCVVDPITNNLVAFKDILPGEKATFNYLTTEWDMTKKFTCNCKEDGCLNTIKGFKYLTPQQRLELNNKLPLALYLSKYVPTPQALQTNELIINPVLFNF
ncbi:hypothetical protein HQ529_03285 [Candidatus Woesearchaeota archaeon]|nr:hypothetical protein [Candidatus Woesearchaeota archaeon]